MDAGHGHAGFGAAAALVVALRSPQPAGRAPGDLIVDPDLRAFASRTLLALREHLAMAEQAAAVAARED